MAVLPSDNPTLLDLMKRKDPDGTPAQIVEALTQRNPILKDMTAKEGNLETGHRVTIRSGLPTNLRWRKINQGVPKGKSSTEQVDEVTGLLEGRSVIDAELVRISGANGPAFRASEDNAFLQQMDIEAATALIYSSTKTDPEKIHGFTPRFNSLTAGNSDNIIDFSTFTAGAESGDDRRSIWFITWHDDAAYGIFPKNTQGGVETKDMGLEYEEDANGDKFLAWRTHFIWRLGLCIRDWRYIVRICNIDVDLNTALTSGADMTALHEAMVEAYNRMYAHGIGRQVIYCSRDVLSLLDRAVVNKSNVYYTPVQWHGMEVTGFRGMPILPLDALNTDEVTVV